MDKAYITKIVALALAEDLGFEGDITTTALIPSTHKSMAEMIVKTNGIICGLDLARAAFYQLDPKVRFKTFVNDGQPVKASFVIARIEGPTRALLSAERVALNFLSYLSGITTKTRLFVNTVRPFKVSILDTRKTTPLLRPLERYAVACGGGVNHRFNLSDMAMIKDNHRVYAKYDHISLNEAVEKIKLTTNKKIEVEVDNLEELAEALLTRTNIILLDNMTPKQTSQAVLMRNRINKKILLESSGGITLKNISKYAATGVDRISVGELTHSRQALDISLEFRS